MDHVAIISYALAALALLAPIIAVIGQMVQGKGIGWQFIRFTAIIVALPLACLLALHDALNDGVLALLAGALGYAFGRSGDANA